MNGRTFAIYTTKQAGFMHAMKCSEDEYARWKADGKITYQGDRIDPTVIEPLVLLALVRVEDHHDFGLGGPRP